MSNKKLLFFVLFVVLQLVVIGGFFAQRLYPLSTGREVVLRTMPIDPRDLIRGEYVALRYEISTINPYLAAGETFKAGDTVYVTLEKGYNGIWGATRISKTRTGDYSIAIKGKVTSVSTANNLRGGVGVEYGIERYFVEAGKGKELERSGRLKVFVKVDNSGASVIERVESTNDVGINDWQDDWETVPVPNTPPSTPSSSDARVKTNLAGIRVSSELYFDRFDNYGEPFALAVCPVSGGSIFFRDDETRQAITIVRNSVASSAGVRCAAGASGTASFATSWAVSASLRSGGSWCVDSTGASRSGVADGGGAQIAVCR